MDSSNAERAWEAYVGRAGFWTGSDRFAFMAGRASRDAEVAELTSRLRWDVAAARVEAFTTESDTFRARGEALVKQISELRAALGDSEARRAELEAVIEKVRGELHHAEDNGHHLSADCQGVAPGEHAPAVRLSNVEAALSTARSVVLEYRDREVAARAVESARDKIMPPYNWTLNPVTGAEDPRLADADQVYCEVHGELSEIAAAIRKGDTNA